MSKIIIERKEKPNIKKIKFDCDKPIHEKLNKFDLLRENFNMPNTTVILGKPGSGKTSLALNFICNKQFYKKCFDHVYIVMPVYSRNSLVDSPLEGLPPDRFYDELSVKTMDDLYEKIQKSSKEKEYSFILYDDVQDALKNTEIALKFKRLIANQRHLKLVSFIMLQNYMTLPSDIRKIVTNYIIFDLGKREVRQLVDDIYKLDKNDFYEIYKKVFGSQETEPHTWLFYNTKNNSLYHEFDKIIIDDKK
jgi:hypothetical protein